MCIHSHWSQVSGLWWWIQCCSIFIHLSLRIKSQLWYFVCFEYICFFLWWNIKYKKRCLFLKVLDLNFVFTDVVLTLFLLLEPTVRTELMEQIPPIAIFLQESRPKFPTAFFEYLMPIVVRYLTDVNNQVRKIGLCELNCWKIVWFSEFEAWEKDNRRVYVG